MSNVLDLSNEWQKAKASIDAHNVSLKEAINLMPQIAKTFNKPSDAVNVSKQITQTKERIKLTSEEIVNQRILRQNSDRLALSNSKLAGAYRNLSAEVSIASEKVQNIIARGKTAEQTQRQYNKELRNAQREFRTLQNRVLEADKAVDKWSRTGERSIGFVKNLISAFGIVGGVTLFASVTKDIFETTKELQSLDKALLLVTGSSQNFAKQQDFLKKIAEDYGVELKGLTKQYTQFYVSAKDKLSGNQIQDIFRSITKAGASMGLSVQQQERAFLALNQIMSKGTIQAEELRGQLGEALPGAFGIMAKAVGVTEKELAKMMKAGEVLAADVLPKFAKQLEITYGIENVNRINNLASAQTRLANAWTNFVASLDKDGNKLSKFFSSILNVTADIVKGLELIFESEAESKKRNAKAINEYRRKEMEDYIKSLKDVNEEDLKNIKSWNARHIKENSEMITELSKRNRLLAKEFNDFFADKTGVSKQYADNKKKIEELNNLNHALAGEIKAINEYETKTNEVRRTGNKLTAEETDKIIKKLREEYLERTKIAELQPKQLEEGFLVKLKEQKKAFEELRDTLSSTSEEYANYQKVVDGLQRSIDLIEDPSKVIKADLSSWENYIKLLKDVETRSEDAKKKTAELEEELKSLFKSIYNGQLSNLGFDSLVPMFDGTFDKMWNTADTFNEKFAVGMKFIGDVAKDTFEFINSQQQANYEAQYQRLEMQKENALLFAGESAVAQKNIEEEYDRRRKEIQRRQAQDKQKIAIFNSLINTAQGVTAALASANIPLAITIGILGAIQTAFIASQKIPQFYKGTKNAPEGIAFTDERGAELHTDKYGNIKDLGSDKGARLKHLSAGDKIYTAEETQRLLFNKDLNNILVKNDIRYSDERTVEEIKSLKEIIKNKPTFAVQIDKRGKAVYEKKNGIRTKILDNVINIKGYDI